MSNLNMVYEGNLRCMTHHESGMDLVTDGPKNIEGKGESFSPTDILALSVSSCMLTFMGMAARKLGIDIKGSEVIVEKVKTTVPPRRVRNMVFKFKMSSLIPKELRSKIEKAAYACPVHNSLHPDTHCQISFTY